MQGRQRELEVGGLQTKGSAFAHIIFLCLPRLDDGVRREPWKRKEKMEKGRGKRWRWRRGWEVSDGPVGFEGKGGIDQGQKCPKYYIWSSGIIFNMQNLRLAD